MNLTLDECEIECDESTVLHSVSADIWLSVLSLLALIMLDLIILDSYDK